MFITNKPIFLASASPRRRKFLADLDLEFTCCPADIDETPYAAETPAAFALRMAQTKAEAVADQYRQAYVIGADTVVTFADKILGKPADSARALEILRSLQGKTHRVITGLALICRDEDCNTTLTRTTKVTFQSFSDSILRSYINTGDPMDKAGAYGIQGKGAFLVRTIQGSCSNVIGLPVGLCTSLLLQYNVISSCP